MKIEIVDISKENIDFTPELPSYPYSCKYGLYWKFPNKTALKREALKKKIK